MNETIQNSQTAKNLSIVICVFVNFVFIIHCKTVCQVIEFELFDLKKKSINKKKSIDIFVKS